MSVPWPDNVRGFDWSAPPMVAPPTEPTQVGYHHWWDEQRGRCSRRYYVLPDGSAAVVSEDESGEPPDRTTYAPGTWEVVYPTTTFGSRGGIWIASARPGNF